MQERKIAELKGAVDQERVNWQTRVDKLEVDRTGLDLRAQMELPADYNTQVTKTIAEAKAAAKVDIAQAQANSATKIASAEAAVISAQGEAAATVMEAKAEAWLKYGENSYVDMVVEQLPKIASSLVMPLSKVGGCPRSLPVHRPPTPKLRRWVGRRRTPARPGPRAWLINRPRCTPRRSTRWC
eukprot:COSAG01_NODE_1905_length_8940_cov_19.008936_4_plen_184_part_00